MMQSSHGAQNDRYLFFQGHGKFETVTAVKIVITFFKKVTSRRLVDGNELREETVDPHFSAKKKKKVYPDDSDFPWNADACVPTVQHDISVLLLLLLLLLLQALQL
jgi:hypothetical protein